MRIKEKNIYNLEKEKKDINNNKKKPPPKKIDMKTIALLLLVKMIM